MDEISGVGPQVTSAIRYVDPQHASGIVYALNPEKNQVRYEQHETRFADARPVADALDLHRNGFTLVRHATRVRNFRDPEETGSVYRAEMEELIKRHTGAAKVIVFHMQIRDNSANTGPDVRKPAPIAHVDYDEETFRTRAREELGEEAEHWLKKPFVAINVWRGVEPVEEMPLAMCDPRSVRPEQLHRATIHERIGDPRPYTALNLSFDAGQKWYYFPRMQTDEAILFKLCDTDPSRMGPVPHAAFADPTSRPGAPPRVSFEVRTLAFFD